VLGYPIITDIKAPWATMHAIVPLAIPAAVGVGMVYSWGREAFDRDETVDVALTVVVLALVVGSMGAMSFNAVYAAPMSGDNELVQFAQPGGDLDPLAETLAAAGDDPDDPDVVFYGTYFVDGATEAPRRPPCVKWFNALPLPWYLERANVTDGQAPVSVSCAKTQAELDRTVAAASPAVVVARTPDRTAAAAELPGYRWDYAEMRAWGTNSTVFVHERYWDTYGDGLRPRDDIATEFPEPGTDGGTGETTGLAG
jgi:predicted membrane-bound mannosyltransferase